MLSGGQAGVEGIGVVAYSMYLRSEKPDKQVCVTYDDIKADVTKGPDIYRAKQFCSTAATVEKARVRAREKARSFFRMPTVFRALADLL